MKNKKKKVNWFVEWLFDIKHPIRDYVLFSFMFMLSVILSIGLANHTKIMGENAFHIYVWSFITICLIYGLFYLINQLEGFFIIGGLGLFIQLLITKINPNNVMVMRYSVYFTAGMYVIYLMKILIPYLTKYVIKDERKTKIKKV